MATMQKPGAFATAMRDRKQVLRSAVVSRRYIYGQCMVSGPLIYVYSNGENNKYVYLVIALAGHQVQEIGDVYLGDKLLTDAVYTKTVHHDEVGHYETDENGTWWTVDAPAYDTTESLVTVTRYLGTADQAAHQELIDVSGGDWTINHRLRGVAYIVVRLEYDSEAFPYGIPAVKAVVRGNNQIYDPRTATTGYTTNWALCIRDFLTKEYGIGCLPDEINEPQAIAAANICDQLISLAEGGSEPRYTINGCFEAGEKPLDIMKRMLSAAMGTVVWSQGQYHIHPAAYRQPEAYIITESDLAGPIGVQPAKSARDKFNTVRGTYVDPSQLWEPVDFPPQVNDLAILTDGRELTNDIELPFTISSAAAQRIAKIHLERELQGVVVSFTGKMTLFGLKPADVVRVSISHLGWNAKEFRVIKWEMAEGGGINLALREESAASYDWNSGLQTVVDTAPNTSLPDPRNVAPPAGIAATDDAVVTTTGIMQRLIIDIGASPQSFVSRYEVQYKSPYNLMWTAITTSGLRAVINNVHAAQEYLLRARAFNMLGVASKYVSTSHITRQASAAVTMITDVSVTGLQAAGGSSTFSGRDCALVWDRPEINSSISYYQVQIHVGDILKRTATASSNSFTYTYGMNLDDNNGVPQPVFTVTVTAVDIGGSASVPASIVASNTVPSTPTALTGTGELMSNRMALAYPVPDDFECAEIWSHTSDVRAGASLVGTTVTNGFLHTGLPAASSRYYWIRIKDLYDQYSPWYPAAGGVNVVAMADPSDVIKLLDADVQNDKLMEYLTGNTSLLDVMDNFQMVFENNVVGPGIVARYTDAIAQNCSDLVFAKNQLTSLQSTVTGLITGEWSSTTSYSIGQFVLYQGQTYQATQPSTNIVPTDTDYWTPVSGIVDLINELQQNLDTATATWTSTATSITARLDAAEPIIDGHTTSISQNAQQIEFATTAMVGPLIAYKTEVFEDGVQVEDFQDVRDLDIRITNTAFRMDTAEGNINLSASRIETIETNTGLLASRLSQAEIDIDGANAAIALKASQTTVNTLTNTVSTKAAQIDLDAANEMVGLKLSKTGTDGAGMAIAYNHDTGKYNTTFLTDTFSIAQPNGTGPVNAFMVGSVAGVPSVGINGQLVVDGTLLARHIAANQLTVGDNVAMGPNAYISWANVTSQPTIPDADYITDITQNTITTSYVNALNVTAASVAAENIIGSTITGKNIVSSTEARRIELTAGINTGLHFYYDGSYAASINPYTKGLMLKSGCFISGTLISSKDPSYQGASWQLYQSDVEFPTDPTYVARFNGGSGTGSGGVVVESTIAPITIVPSINASAPTHGAPNGTLWVTGAGVLYIHMYGQWTKVGAQ